MGLGLSRPQYNYIDRVRPVEYFKTCDPADCFCGTTHTRERNVAVFRGPGGQEVYRDPSEVMNGMLMGAGYGRPGMGYGLAPGYMQQPMMAPMSMMTVPNAITGNSMTPGVNISTLANPSSNQHWPAEWKDPSEWTVRDFNRLGEIMDEYLSRQRGRGYDPSSFKPMSSPHMSRDDSWMPPYASSPFNRQQNRSPELEQLQAQMMRYVEESKQQMQAMSDFLYGSERERREEMYKERQRKMIEDIVKNLYGPVHGAESSPAATSRPEGMLPMPSMYGQMPSYGQTPFMPYGPPPGMMGGYQGGIPGMNPYQSPMGMESSMNDWTGGRGTLGRFPARRKPIGFNDDFNDFDRRRPRRTGRLGFDDDCDDILSLGGDDDDDLSPRRPAAPRRPRPDRGGGDGSGALFSNEMADRMRQSRAPPEPRVVRFATPEVQDRSTQIPAEPWPAVSEPAAQRPTSSPPPMPPGFSGRPRPYSYAGNWPDSSQSSGAAVTSAPGTRIDDGLPPYSQQPSVPPRPGQQG